MSVVDDDDDDRSVFSLRYDCRAVTTLKSNYTYSICCGFVVQQAVQQVHNKSHTKSTTNLQQSESCTTNPQQIEAM